MKKLLTVLCVALLVVVLGVSASAAEEPSEGSLGDILNTLPKGLSVDQQVEWVRQTYLDAGYTDISETARARAKAQGISGKTAALAYQDLEGANEATKAAILAARNEIIYTRSWRADDVILMNANPETKTIDIVPKFSEVFPGWDLPVDPASIDTKPGVSRIPDSANSDIQTMVQPEFRGSYYIPANTHVSNAPEMCSVYVEGIRFEVSTYALSLPTGMNTFNVGLTDKSNGKSIGYKMNIRAGQSNAYTYAFTDPSKYNRVSVRTSTDSTPGTANMCVDSKLWYRGPITPPQAYSSSDEDLYMSMISDQLANRDDADFDDEEMTRATYLALGYVEVPPSLTPGYDIPEEVLEIANQDISKADSATKEEILKARRRVIFSYSWTADDGIGISLSEGENGQKQFTIEPKFSQLFPGWDLPVD